MSINNELKKSIEDMENASMRLSKSLVNRKGIDESLDINNIVSDVSFDQTLNIFLSDLVTLKTGWEYKVLYMDYIEKILFPDLYCFQK